MDSTMFTPEAEKQLSTANRISIIFLLYDDYEAALRAAQNFDGTQATPIADWSRIHADKTERLCEALALTKNFRTLEKEFEKSKKEACTLYKPLEEEAQQLYVPALRRKLFFLCEEVRDDQIVQFVEHMRPGDSNRLRYSCLELYLLRWMLDQDPDISENSSDIYHALGRLELKRAQKLFIRKQPGFYKINYDKMGTCIIINQKYFRSPDPKQPPEMDPRIGTVVDRDLLHETFLMYGYDVKIWESLNKEELKSYLYRASREILSEHCSLVVCILSHGERGQIYCSDTERITTEEIQRYFQPDNCLQLTEKPKLFFIQACQGEHSQIGVPTPRHVSSFALDTDSPEVVHTVGVVPVNPQTHVTSNLADFLTFHSTVQGFLSYRDKIKGSKFVTSVCSVLTKDISIPNDFSAANELVSRLKIVNMNQTTNQCQILTTCSQYSTSLRGDLILKLYPEGMICAFTMKARRIHVDRLVNSFIQNYIRKRRGIRTQSQARM